MARVYRTPDIRQNLVFGCHIRVPNVFLKKNYARGFHKTHDILTTHDWLVNHLFDLLSFIDINFYNNK